MEFGSYVPMIHRCVMLGGLYSQSVFDCSADGVTTTPQDSAAQEKLLAVAQNAKNLVVFSGSGLSAGSGGTPQVCICVFAKMLTSIA